MKKAFSLVELLVVIGIIAVLAGILIAALSGSTESAKAAKCLANMKSIANAFHAEAMNSGYFPLAGSVDVYASSLLITRNKGVNVQQGWIGWKSGEAGSGYVSPYEEDEERRRKSLENGSIWKAISSNQGAFVCPTHREIVKKKMGSTLKNGPLWSYVVNADFGWMYKSDPFIWAPSQQFDKLRRLDRKLLLAELPFLDLKQGGAAVQTPVFETKGKKENDPILHYANCAGGGDEIIGFNHRMNKREVFAHVCYADGHTEKLRLPKSPSTSNLRDLTKWLCKTTDDRGKQIDVAFDGRAYVAVSGE